jgi:hypothetical protein
MEAENEGQKKTLDVYPVGKGKRILLFLADFFLCFIFSIFIFSFAVFPSGKAISNYVGIQNQIATDEKNQLSLLSSQGLIFYDNVDDSSETMGKKTAKMFLMYHIKGAGLEDNVFYNYYGIVKGEASSLAALYDKYDRHLEANTTLGVYFSKVLDANGIPKLNDTYLKEFAPVTEEGNSLSDNAENDYSDFLDYFFSPFYKAVIDDLVKNYQGSQAQLVQYQSLEKDIVNGTAFLDRVVVYSSYVCYAFCILVYFLLVPLIDKRGRTLGMLIMKLERVGSDSLKIVSWKEKTIYVVFDLVSNLGFVFFLPAAFIAFAYLFNLPSLLPLSLIGLGFSLISLVFLLASKFNKTLVDFLTKTVIIDRETLELIYAAKGYYL